MLLPNAADLQPRKRPRQSRSQVTFDAICEAGLQVLGKDGADHLTTTRVADRAGVSVGTLYQYFPHKRAILFAASQRHLAATAQALVHACERPSGCSIHALPEAFVGAYVDLKMSGCHRRSVVHGLVRELGLQDMHAANTRRVNAAVERLLLSVPNAFFPDVNRSVATLMATLREAAPLLHQRLGDRQGTEALRDDMIGFARRHWQGNVLRGA